MKKGKVFLIGELVCTTSVNAAFNSVAGCSGNAVQGKFLQAFMEWHAPYQRVENTFGR